MTLRKVLVRLLILLTAIPALAEDSVPSLLRLASADTSAPPVWITAELALAASGLPRSEYSAVTGDELVTLDDRGNPRPVDAAPPGAALTVRNSYRRQLTAPEIDALNADAGSLSKLACPANDVMFGFDWDATLSATSVMDRAAIAEEVYLLEIQSIDHGFVQRMPHSLLDNRVERAFRSTSGVAAGDRMLVAYRYAQFVAGTTLWCNIDPAFNLRPQPGDRLLLIRRPAPLRVTTNELGLIVPDQYEVILGRPDDTIVWSRELRKLDPETAVKVKSFAELLALIQIATGSPGIGEARP